MQLKTLVLKVLPALVAGYASSAAAGARFFVPETLYAAPGVECRVFFARVFESVRHSNYAFEALSEKGNFWEDRWCWTPTAEDAGKRVDVVFRALTDDGLVDCATTTVVVAKSPTQEQKSRRITLALFSASCTNCRYQDRLRERMREAGFAGYTPVGSHTGASASMVCDPEKGAPHDGYGIDPVRAYPRTERDGNALHGTELSGRQAGDALFAWLLNDIEGRVAGAGPKEAVH